MFSVIFPVAARWHWSDTKAFSKLWPAHHLYHSRVICAFFRREPSTTVIPSQLLHNGNWIHHSSSEYVSMLTYRACVATSFKCHGRHVYKWEFRTIPKTCTKYILSNYGILYPHAKITFKKYFRSNTILCLLYIYKEQNEKQEMSTKTACRLWKNSKLTFWQNYR